MWFWHQLFCWYPGEWVVHAVDRYFIVYRLHLRKQLQRCRGTAPQPHHPGLSCIRYVTTSCMTCDKVPILPRIEKNARIVIAKTWPARRNVGHEVYGIDSIENQKFVGIVQKASCSWVSMWWDSLFLILFPFVVFPSPHILPLVGPFLAFRSPLPFASAKTSLGVRGNAPIQLSVCIISLIGKSR